MRVAQLMRKHGTIASIPATHTGALRPPARLFGTDYAFLATALLLLILPSSIIIPVLEYIPIWHPGHISVVDVALVFVLVARITAHGLPVLPAHGLFFALLFVAVTVSLVSGYLHGASVSVLDALIYPVRAATIFLLAMAIFYRNGPKAVDSLCVVSFIALSISVGFVIALEFPAVTRPWASGLTVGSTGQLAALVALFAAAQNSKYLLAAAVALLMFTLSRTSIIAFAISLAILFTVNSQHLSSTRRRWVIAALLSSPLVFVFTAPLLTDFGQTLTGLSDWENLRTLSQRQTVYDLGLEVVGSGDVPIFGIGFHHTPHYLDSLVQLTEAGEVRYPHFHNLLIEYAIGLGILAVPLIALLAMRTYSYFSDRSTLSAAIATCFWITQTFDFTLYQPKQIVFWALFWAVAESRHLITQQVIEQRLATRVRHLNLRQS
jgi:hypothetical protein